MRQRLIHTVTMDFPDEALADEVLDLIWNVLDDNRIGYTECSIDIPGVPAGEEK